MSAARQPVSDQLFPDSETARAPARPVLLAGSQADQEGLIRRIRELGPWHHDIRLTPELTVADVFPEAVPRVDRNLNLGVPFIQPRDGFLEQLDRIYPSGLAGKTMLDCACNGGGYCFWAAEREVESAFGFDIREHWIRQARFVQAQRRVASTDQLRFAVADLMELPRWRLQPFDLTVFKGIFSHLADPVGGLRIAAELTRDVLIFNSPLASGSRDCQLHCVTENSQRLMAGTSGFKWLPTGPRVIANLLRWLGFTDIRLVFQSDPTESRPRGRIEILAAREAGRLDLVNGDEI